MSVFERINICRKIGMSVKEVNEIVSRGREYEYADVDYIGMFIVNCKDAGIICKVLSMWGINIREEYANKIINIWLCADDGREEIFNIDAECIYRIMSNKDSSVEDKIEEFDMFECEDSISKLEMKKIFNLWGYDIGM